MVGSDRLCCWRELITHFVGCGTILFGCLPPALLLYFLLLRARSLYQHVHWQGCASQGQLLAPERLALSCRNSICPIGHIGSNKQVYVLLFIYICNTYDTVSRSVSIVYGYWGSTVIRVGIYKPYIQKCGQLP